MCFNPTKAATRELRKRTKEPHIGFKAVTRHFRMSPTYSSMVYRKGATVRCRETFGEVYRYPATREAGPRTEMRAGLYLYRTRAAALHHMDPGHTILRCSYKPEHVLGAKADMVCVTKLKVLS